MQSGTFSFHWAQASNTWPRSKESVTCSTVMWNKWPWPRVLLHLGISAFFTASSKIHQAGRDLEALHREKARWQNCVRYIARCYTWCLYLDQALGQTAQSCFMILLTCLLAQSRFWYRHTEQSRYKAPKLRHKTPKLRHKTPKDLTVLHQNFGVFRFCPWNKRLQGSCRLFRIPPQHTTCHFSMSAAMK